MDCDSHSVYSWSANEYRLGHSFKCTQHHRNIQKALTRLYHHKPYNKTAPENGYKKHPKCLISHHPLLLTKFKNQTANLVYMKE